MKEKAKGGRTVYLLLLIFVVLIWGTAPNVSKYLLGHYSPAAKTAFTSLVAFLAVLGICAGKLKKLNRQYFKIAVPTGVFYSSAYVLQQIGLSKTSPTMYAFLENLSCLVVPLMVWVMTRRRPRIFQFIAAGLCILSVYILGGGSLFSGGLGVGDLLCGLAGLLYGVNIAVTGIKAKKLDAGLYLLIQFGVNCIISTTYALSFEDITFSVNAGHLALCIGITLVSSVMGWIIRTVCLQHLDPSLVAVVMPFSSVVTAIISVIIGNDVLSVNLVVGALLGVFAALVADFDPVRFKKKFRKKAVVKEGVAEVSPQEEVAPVPPSPQEEAAPTDTV